MVTKPMGDLCSCAEEADKDLFDGIVKLIDQNFPADWRSWLINDVSLEEALEGDLTTKLRFALPTADLGTLFNENLFERKYRWFKRKLLNWPLGRAILYSPHCIVDRVHAESCEKIIASVRGLKKHIT